MPWSPPEVGACRNASAHSAQIAPEHVNADSQHQSACMKRTIQPQIRREMALFRNEDTGQSSSIFIRQWFHRCGHNPQRVPMWCGLNRLSPARGCAGWIISSVAIKHPPLCCTLVSAVDGFSLFVSLFPLFGDRYSWRQEGEYLGASPPS